MAKSKAKQAQISQVVQTPPLTGGWNARDPLAAMPNTDAVILTNLIPGTGGISLRPGYSSHVTGIAGPVSSLLHYNGLNGIEKLFAASGAKIFDVTIPGAVGAAVVTGLTSDDWTGVMFGTPAPKNYLVAANGADPVENFDGTTWTTPTITGVSSSVLMSPAVGASRLFFIEKGTLHLWYLGIGAISGAATEFDLSTQAGRGGYLVALTSWSQDGGSGPNDYFVAITSAGEALIYQGTDPSTLTTWGLVGKFRIPEPVGHRCVIKSGADVAIITTLGVVPLSAILPISISGQGKAAVNDKIKGAFAQAYMQAGTFPGWQIIEYPKGALVLVNVPQPDGVTFQQFVMNTVTAAWCNFVNMDGLSWALLNQDLFFGDTTGTVWQFDTGNVDDDNPISGVVLPAFSDFGVGGFKRFLMARPLYTTAVGSNPPVEVRVDYDQSPPSAGQVNVPSRGSPWDISPWDISPWEVTLGSVSEWQSIEGIGQVGSVMISTSSNNGLTLNHIDVMFEGGGFF